MGPKFQRFFVTAYKFLSCLCKIVYASHLAAIKH